MVRTPREPQTKSMPDIQAFHGIRYDLGHVGTLSDVVAPPYDVIDPQQRDELYRRHPANFVRVILNRPEPGDDEQHNPYTRAARFLRNWQAEGLLFTEAVPAVYVYHQQFSVDGEQFTRRGFMSRVRLEPFGEGTIYPHEETMSGPKEDRLRLTQACRTNLSPIFGLYPDPQSQAQELLESSIVGSTPIKAVDADGVIHRLWTVAEPKVIAELAGAVGPKPAFIADGHHRYETACNYRRELAAGGSLDPNHPANFVLMMCVSMSDPGMIVLPTHRLFRGLPKLTSTQLADQLGEAFHTEILGQGAAAASDVWQQIETAGQQETIGLFAAGDQRWVLAMLSEAGRRQMADLAGDHGDAWRSLGVSILHRLMIETLLDGRDLPTPNYVHRVDEVSTLIQSGDYTLAALVMPATLDHVRAISEDAERMPAKSTYFYPKLLSGLVSNPLE